MRTLIVCPGRGSYGPRELGTLARAAAESEAAERTVSEVVAAIDAARAEHGLGSIRELDDKKAFGPEHQEAQNASALIFACSLVDASLVLARTRPAGVIGNSLGFYTALAVSGALALEDAARLVVGMSALQAKHGQGAQLLVPLVGDDWRPDAAREQLVARVLREHEGRVYPSIHLGGFAVLAVATDALDEVKKAIGVVRSSGRDYPLVLEGHHGYHSPLVEDVADHAALARFGGFRAPSMHLVDGRGAIFTPWSTEPRELAGYAIGTQVREPFDFTASVRVGLRELGPDALVLLGPGESIGGAIGHVLVRERWSGIASKDDFQARQSKDPILYAMGRSDQRAKLLQMPVGGA